MSELEQRAEVVRVARTWVGTRYHHEGRIKGVGVDCGMLLAEVFAEAGLIARPDIKSYSPQFFLHSDDPAYIREIERFAHAVAAPTGPGDLVVYKLLRQYAHGGIITELEPRRIVHAYAPAERVLEGREFEFAKLVAAEKLFYSVW